VRVTATVTEQRFVIEVADDGPGIPVADRDRIFDRFVRLDSSRDRGSGTTGLGLAIAREIADAHHGGITIADTHHGGISVADTQHGGARFVVAAVRGPADLRHTRLKASRKEACAKLQHRCYSTFAIFNGREAQR
jgi:signal transduction histidine kinase